MPNTYIYGYRVLCIEGNKYTKVEVEYITDMLDLETMNKEKLYIKWPIVSLTNVINCQDSISCFRNRQFDVRYGCNLLHALTLHFHWEWLVNT